MDLDERLKKIATGVSVSDAIESYMDTLAAHGEEVDPEEEKRAEMLAIVEIMFLMAAVDGEVSEEEVDELRASLMAIEDLGEIRGRVDLESVMQEFSQRLAAEGWRTRVNAAAVKIRAPEARAFAFQLAAGVAFVDDFVAHAEAAAIDALAQALALPEAEAQELLRDVHASLFGAE